MRWDWNRSWLKQEAKIRSGTKKMKKMIMKFALKLNMNRRQAVFLPANEGPAGSSVAPCRVDNLLKTWLQLSCPLIQGTRRAGCRRSCQQDNRFSCPHCSRRSLACLVSSASIRNLSCWHLCLGVLGLTTEPFAYSLNRGRNLPGNGGHIPASWRCSLRGYWIPCGEAGSHLSYKHVRKSIVFEFLFYWKTQGPFLPEYFSLHWSLPVRC